MPETTKTISKDLVFPKAGHFMLQKYKEGGILDLENFYLSSHGIVKLIKRATTITTSSLPDGNSVYDAQEYPTKEETILTFGLSTYDPELEAFVKGASFNENTENKVVSSLQNDTISDECTIVLSKKVVDAKFKIAIKDKFGNKFLRVEEAEPTTGQYKVAVEADKATLTFATADKGKEVYIIYDAVYEAVATMEYEEKPKLVPMKVTVIGETNSSDETETYVTNIVIDKATLNGGITPPEQTNDPTGGWEISLKTGKPRAGKKPVAITYAK